MKNKKNLRLQDPFLEREREQYESPLPSREFILQILTEQGAPVADEELLEMLHIDKDEQDLFARRLRAMERDGQIMRNRKGAICVVDKLDLVKGKVQGHPDGFGFLIPEDGSPDMFLSEKEMHQVLHGDVVMVRQSGVDRRGRPEAKIVEVLERANNRVVGRLYEEHGIYFVVAENRRITQDILVAPGESGGAKAGQVVVLEILQHPDKHAQPIGRIVEVLGNYADPGMEIEIALRKHDLPYEFPKDAERQAKAISPSVAAADWAGREDIRNLPLVTIDGETARDFDDAVYCAPEKGGYRLVVAIADVSHYVQTGDALDREAINRGNSVYFPRRVIPMLPEELSNGLCSLNPHVDRLCMVCDMHISSSGEIETYRFYPSVMHSKARLTYNQVAAMLAEPDGELAKTNAFHRAASAGSARTVQETAESAREARRDRLRDGRDADDLHRPGQDRAHRAGGAQRRAQADRGMHAGGQRLRGRFPARTRTHRAVPHPRRADAGKAGSAARIHEGVRPAIDRRRRPAGSRLLQAAQAHQRPPRCMACCRP